jgi:hypothetical protein
VHNRKLRVAEHRGQQPRDPTDDVDADLQLAVLGGEPLQLVDQRRHIAGLVVDTPVQQHLAARSLDGPGPVELLGDIDADRDPHVPPLRRVGLKKPLSPDRALHNERSQCLISGLREAARRGSAP